MQGGPSSTHHIVIINDNGVYRVVPGELVAGSGDRVVYHSLLAAEDADMEFPTAVLEDEAGHQPVHSHRLRAAGHAPFVVNRRNAQTGAYPYRVRVGKADAAGNSQPKLIIYR